jgi:hypothetical protein
VTLLDRFTPAERECWAMAFIALSKMPSRVRVWG